ncbi:MAG: MarR family transcriptional regulator [Deltaproteobacteria bacterium]
MGNAAALADIHEAIACLSRLTEVYGSRRQELAEQAGLTEQQWSVLDEIENEAFMPSLFARRRESSAAAVSKILRQLQDKELVVVSVRANDGRQRHYELSALGKQTMNRLRTLRQHAISEVWERLDATEVKAFARFGNELLERLERYSRELDQASPGARRGLDNGKDAIRQGL